MHKTFVLLIIIIFMTFGLGWAEESAIKTSEFGYKFIDAPVGHCSLEVLFFKGGHLRIEVSSAECDPLSGPMLSEVIRRMEVLIRSEQKRHKNLDLQIYLCHHPTILKKWAMALRGSTEWKKLSKSKNSWDTSEYALIVKLMNESRVFEDYQTLFDRMGYEYETVAIEKVDYSKAGKYSFYAKDLKPIGYSVRERIPVPLATILKFHAK